MQLNCDQWDRSRSFLFAPLSLPADWNVDKMAEAQADILDPEVEALVTDDAGGTKKEEPGVEMPYHLWSPVSQHKKAMSAVLNINVLMCEVVLCNFRMSVTAQSIPPNGPQWPPQIRKLIRHLPQDSIFSKIWEGKKAIFPFSSFFPKLI